MENLNIVEYINAPEIEPRQRHPIIIETFDKLERGQYLQLQNDHDPKPLHYQFMMERGDTFTWKYLEDGPLTWKVAIGKL